MESRNNNVVIDLFQRINDWSHVKQLGYNYMIQRAWRSMGKFDENVVSNINGAREAGIENVDIYMFPCRGKDAKA